jgi:hypothetical protein
MIFVSAPRILDARHTNDDDDAGTLIPTEDHTADSHGEQEETLPFPDRRGGSREISLTLYRVFPEETEQVVGGSTSGADDEPSASPIKDDAAAATAVEDDGRASLESRLFDGSSVVNGSADDSTGDASRSEGRTADPEKHGTPWCAHVGRPLPSSWVRGDRRSNP